MNKSEYTAHAAKFAGELTFEKVPCEVISILKKSFMDTIGVMLAGSKSDEGRTIIKYVKASNEPGPISVVGSGLCATVDTAALANGTFSHALDFDDCCDSVKGHPSVSLVPTILTLCQLAKVSGTEAITAYAAGLEVEAYLGIAIGDSCYEKGFHTTGTLGAFGATVAAGKLLGLNESQFRRALGMAASMSSGLKQNFGTMTKPLHAGLACRNGILAARLAKLGYTANETIFEAKQSYQRAYCKENDYCFDGLGEKLGVDWNCLEPGIIHKKWACCAETHRGIEAAIALSSKIGDIDRVRHVECLVQERNINVCIYPRPKTGLEAKFSQEYCVARALMHGEVRLEHFEDAAVNDPDLLKVIDKVKMSVDPQQQGRGDIKDERTTIVVTLDDGSELSESVRVPLGSKERPLSDAELVGKFIDCAKGVLDDREAEKAIELCSALEKLDDLTEVTRTIVGHCSGQK